MTRDPARALSLVGGEWVEGAGETIITSPADGAPVGTVSLGDDVMAVRAADSAAHAFDSWSHSSAKERSRLLRRAAELLSERCDDLAVVLSRETGKRMPEAVAEVMFSAEYLLWFAEELRRPEGSVIPSETPGRRNLTIRRPSGVVVSLTPWNFPVSIPARKIAAMLAAGCTVVARVSERAPLAATEFIRVLNDAGAPDGVVNLVHGPAGAVTDAWLTHDAVRVVSFTGSTAVGRRVMASASERLIKPVMELGGNAPFIVCADADIDAAVDAAVLARTRNAGQSCVAANRFFAHAEVIDEFGGRFAERLDAMSVGSPSGDGAGGSVADLGPMIDSASATRVRDLVAATVDAGGSLLTRRRETPAAGSYAVPALVAVDRDDVPLMQQEVFGPAAAVASFSDVDEVIARANATEMGLAAYAFTRSSATAWRLSERLEAGIIGINDPLPSVVYAPMGGVKQSGMGREGSSQGLDEFQDLRHISWRD